MLEWIWADLDLIIDCYSDRTAEKSAATLSSGDEKNAETESVPDRSGTKGLIKHDKGQKAV